MDLSRLTAISDAGSTPAASTNAFLRDTDFIARAEWAFSSSIQKN